MILGEQTLFLWLFAQSYTQKCRWSCMPCKSGALGEKYNRGASKQTNKQKKISFDTIFL